MKKIWFVVCILSLTVLSFAQDENDEKYFQEGLEKYSKSDWSGAVESFTQAIDANPEMVKAYNNRGLAEGRIKDYKGALKDFSAAIKLSPKADYYRNRGWIKIYLKDYEGAIKDCTTAIEKKPYLANAYSYKGYAEYANKDYKAALKDLKTAVEFDPLLKKSYQRYIDESAKKIPPPPKSDKDKKDENDKDQKDSDDKIPFNKISTENYLIKYEDAIPKERIQKFAKGMNLIHKKYKEIYGVTKDTKFYATIKVYATRENFRKYEDIEGSIVAFYQPATQELIGYLEKDEGEFFHTFFHEASHQFCDMAVARTSGILPWFNEGIAECLGGSGWTPDGDFYTFNIDRSIREQRLCVIQASIRGKAYFPFAEFIEMPYEEFYSEEKESNSGRGKMGQSFTQMQIAYAQGWSFCYFLYKQHKEILARYVAAVKNGKGAKDANDAAFKSVKLDVLEAEWLEFMSHLPG